MKAKRILITTCGIILSGLVVATGASAVTFEGSSDVQFTFNPVLSLSLSADGFLIDNLVPGASGISNEVTATVSSNGSAGYILSATVGDSTTYTTTDLKNATNNTIAMISSGTSLTSGTWGYTLNNGTDYGALALYTGTGTVLRETSGSGETTTAMKIGAYAATSQATGEYRNVVNFSVVSKIAAHTVTLTAGAHTATVSINGGAASSTSASGSYEAGDTVTIAATCDSSYTFTGWGIDHDYGSIANPANASTTYTVGGGSVNLTAYCQGS